MKNLLVALFFAVSCFTVKAQSPATFLPAFKFYTPSNKAYTKAHIPIGKQSLFVFFDGTCPHCQKVMGSLAKHNEELKQANVYLVSLDEFKTINYFMEHYGKALIGMKNVTLLQDRDHVFIPLFKPTKYPAMFLYGTDQRLKIYSSEEEDILKIL
ncbi:peroxiredoxin family protein, partial [Pedobacter sp.]|uniref:peroxiredoxin family protein n=1 Tax=Pedobacter sp. TaxID=1411316 RepID=UPI003D7F6CC7